MRRISRSLLMLALIALMLPQLGAHAQEGDFRVQVAPASGPPGTTVTIQGRGAPANTRLRVLYAPFDDPAACRLGRGAELVAEVTSNAQGEFSATHQADKREAGQAGITYLAKGYGAGAASSNLVCFTFSSEGNARFFPETGHTISGRFLEYWQQHGGLMVFGYPLSTAHSETNSSGDTVLTQYFERQRFEHHPQNARPYDVLLGRLGAELLALNGVDPQSIPNAEPNADCMWFEQTQHNVCNQSANLGFQQYWTSHGLEFDGQAGASWEESLALFGYPLTEAFVTTNSSGDTVLTQWFERARFEWHPDNPDQFKVLLGRLGAEYTVKR